MVQQIANEDPKAFIGRLQKMVLEAPSSEAALAALPQIFDERLRLYLNGQELGWPWFREHVQQLQHRLRDVEVEVTHAVRSGDVLMERHLIRGREASGGMPWRMEVMAVYELTREDKIVAHYELTNMLEGVYEGGW